MKFYFVISFANDLNYFITNCKIFIYNLLIHAGYNKHHNNQNISDVIILGEQNMQKLKSKFWTTCPIT